MTAESIEYLADCLKGVTKVLRDYLDEKSSAVMTEQCCEVGTPKGNVCDMLEEMAVEMRHAEWTREYVAMMLLEINNAVLAVLNETDL